MRLHVSHDFLPKCPSSHAAVVMDHFGIGFETGRHTIVDRFELPLEPGQVVLFTGPSGAGKSSLLHAAAEQLGNSSPTPESRPPTPLHIDSLDLGERILVDALDLLPHESLPLLASCGLGEARLLLRTPAELSDGQRYRFRLALALSKKPAWIVADEFTATLDRTLAKVVAFNVRRLADRTQTGFLLATTHEDIARDLAPDLHVTCRLDAPPVLAPREGNCGFRIADCGLEEAKPQATNGNGLDRSVRPDLRAQPSTFDPQLPADPKSAIRNPQSSPRLPSFAPDLRLTLGSQRDWPFFARWHYRSHHLGVVRHVVLLHHADEPIGICVFTSPPLALSQRNRFFGISSHWSRTKIRLLNRQLVILSRVVLHPTYRGAGIASLFVRRACESCPWPWIEALAEMGHLNPFFEKAGFLRVGVTRKPSHSRQAHSAIYGGRRGPKKVLVSQETFEKSRHARPVYYIFDNRAAAGRLRISDCGLRIDGQCDP